MINQLSIDDVQLANEALEAWNKAERRAHERIEREAAAKMKGRGR